MQNVNDFLAQHGGKNIHPRELEQMFWGDWDDAFRKARETNDEAEIAKLGAQVETVLEDLGEPTPKK